MEHIKDILPRVIKQIEDKYNRKNKKKQEQK